ncbi:unnamed protein product [Bursaphelenchus okinawaensis]|uniref:Nuclear receptor domain-containing protein n=1 Tax=Bursaphelenchus okinawaensis TaxID=465554 RepID=A0A811KXM0_9BILA|nr:unnamed protein product [Bursaphelenchus okinawaensis]CAG9115095.1 unnamed protein product [Bursaphelenchus okinawaensis]
MVSHVVVLCSGCKGFFRRSVRFRRQYVCAFNNKCNVIGEARNSCRACRYRSCIEGGLQPNLVHSDRACDADAPKKKLKIEFKKSDSEDKSKTDDEELPSVSALVDEATIVEEANKQCDSLLLARHSMRGKRSLLPLGALNLVPLSGDKSPISLLKYYFTVDRFCDSYFEDDKNVLFTDPITCDLEMSFDEAFLYDPGKMCDRTVMLWEPKIIINFQTFKAMWCRVMLTYIDWVTHVPEIRALEAEDRMKLIVGRSVPIIWHIIAARSLPYVDKKYILLGGGTYFTPDAEVLEGKTEEIIFNFCIETGTWLNDAFFEPAVELGVTQSELMFLRLIGLFSIVPGLSVQGRREVKSTQHFYRNCLQKYITESRPEMTEVEVCQRMSELMLLLPAFDRTNQLEDNHFTMLVLFNLANMQTSLMYDFYVRRKMRL